MERFLRRVLGQLQAVTQELDFSGWAVVMARLLTCGWFFLRGHKIQST